MNILQYFYANNIMLEEKYFNDKVKNKLSLDVFNQIDIIVKLHEILKNGSKTIIPRINSNIGRELENMKVDIKKNKKFFSNLSECKENNFEIKQQIQYILSEADSQINKIDSELYYRLIKRSMKNYEICIGRVDERNIILSNNNTIVIKTDKYISYNLIEHDCYNFIKYLRRREDNINTIAIINYFVEKSNLSEDSNKYLNILSKYPYYEMKVLSKFRCEKINEKEFLNKFKLAMKYDNYSDNGVNHE